LCERCLARRQRDGTLGGNDSIGEKLVGAECMELAPQNFKTIYTKTKTL
jgi:hypothetical protein